MYLPAYVSLKIQNFRQNPRVSSTRVSDATRFCEREHFHSERFYLCRRDAKAFEMASEGERGQGQDRGERDKKREDERRRDT